MIWFSSKKNFCQDQKIHSQNNMWLTVSPKDMPRVMQTTFPATSMVFSVPEGLKLNTNGYIHILSKVVRPWIDHVAAGGLYMWHQDSVPCHTS